jgi:uncharacterized membrane protein
VTIVRWAHIFGGSVALIALWIPMVTRKGSRLHRRAGWVYACAMWTAALAALGLCAVRLLDADKSNDGAAWLLAFLGLLAANGAITGIRALRTKARVQGRARRFDLASSALFMAASVALGGFGLAKGSTLHLAFSVLGLFLAARQLRYWLRGPRSPKDWWYLHMGNMLAAYIGTVTAFIVVNLPTFGLQRYAVPAFLGPGVLGGLAITIWTRHYRRKFAGPAVPAAAVSAPSID